MNSMTNFAKVSATFLVVLSYNSLAARAATEYPQQAISNPQQTSIALYQADSKLITENRNLLIKNGALARKIAAKLGISVTPMDVPTSGTPLEQNQSMILQNQKVFRDIADKVGASAAPMPEVNSTDPAEKNHQLLLVNRGIMGSILKKLAIKPTPPTLTGNFVQKNNILLKANGAALAKVAAKLGVK